MEQLRYECRVEKKVQKHSVIAEFNLGDNNVCVQCLGCGVIGVMDRSDAIDG
jgi:hypothetical protein